jgi:hypothetical protein
MLRAARGKGELRGRDRKRMSLVVQIRRLVPVETRMHHGALCRPYRGDVRNGNRTEARLSRPTGDRARARQAPASQATVGGSTGVVDFVVVAEVRPALVGFAELYQQLW